MRWSMETLFSLDHLGVDPAPDGPHQLDYPDNGCGTACFTSSDQNIRIPMQLKFLDRYTVQHELGHSVVHQYWDQSGVAFVGGEHGLDECGLLPKEDENESEDSVRARTRALRYQEALATFISMWSHDADDGDEYFHPSDPFNPEVPSPNCIITDGSLIEEYITGALWDLHDHRDDGADITGAADPAGVVKFVLGNPVTDANALRALLLKAMPDHTTWVKGVFTQAKFVG